MKEIIDKFNKIEGIEVKDASDKSLELHILDASDYLKWDHFLEYLEGTPSNIEIKRKYPYIYIYIPLSDIDRCKEDINHCLDRKFYLIEKPVTGSLTVIAKVTNLCNMDCQYCYDRPFRNRIGHNKQLKMEELDKLMKLTSEYAKSVTVIFHGGEPTLVGLDYYKKFFSEVYPKYPYCDFSFDIQTNGTLINEEWINFFAEYNVQIGTSYSAKSEDLRETKEDNESLVANEDIFSVIPIIMKSIEADSPIGVIDVTTKFNHPMMIERYEFYKEKGIGCAFNHVDKTGEAKNHEFTFETGQDNKDYLENTYKYFKYWLTDNDAMCERYASMYLELLLTGECETCNYGGECIGQWAGLNSNGEFFPCDRPLSAEYSMGNINSIESYVDIYNSENYKKYIRDREHKKEFYCKNCMVYDYCKGGCPMEDIDFHGKADRPNRYSCKMLKFNLTCMFRALASVTIDELSPLVRKYLFLNVRFLPQEIPKIIDALNIKDEFPGLNFDASKVKLNSDEFKLFRAFNSPIQEEWLNDDFTYIADMDIDEEECEDNRFEILLMKLKELSEQDDPDDEPEENEDEI